MALPASTLKRFHFWHLLVWLGPGAVVAVIFKDAVWLVIFMSWWTIIVEAAIAWQSSRAEDDNTVEQRLDRIEAKIDKLTEE